MHREHDVSVFFSNIVKNIEVDVFFKKSPKNRIVKNWKTSHREKHRIVKKSEHRPPLASGHPDQPAVPHHGDQHANHCLGTQPAPGPSGRGDRGPSKAESVVRITAAPLTADGPGQP